MRVYCGLASAGQRIPMAVVDGAGRLIASREVDDTPTGYATLMCLISKHCADTAQVRATMATDSETSLIPMLLAAAGDPLAIGDAGTVAQFISDEPAATAEPHRRALALARALQSGVLPATTQPAPRDLATLRPVLTAHRAAVVGRGAAVAMLRELLRELYPPALRTFPDPGTPLALAVLERLASPAEVDGIRDGDVLSQLRAAGHPGAEADTAVAALRRAVAETSPRIGPSEAVAAAIRDGVVAVRAAESAAAGLVNVVVERVEPRTSGRGFPTVPPVPGSPVSGPPVSGGPLPTRPGSGPPTSAVPAVGSRTAGSPTIPAPVSGSPISENPRSPQRAPGGRPLPTRDTSIAAAFAPPPSVPPASAPPAAAPRSHQTPASTRQRPPVVPPTVPTSRHHSGSTAGSWQEPPTDGYPTAPPDTTGSVRSGGPGSPGIGGSTIPGSANTVLPGTSLAAGFPTSGSPAVKGRNLNGTVPSGAVNSARHRENKPPQPPSGPLAPPTGSAAPDQSDEELSLLSPDELSGGPNQRGSETSRYSDPTSGRLAALIEFPGSARRQAAPTQQNTNAYREQPTRDTRDEVTREHRDSSPRREPSRRSPASPPLGETDGDLLIFAQARSAWFSDPEEGNDQEPEWRSEADAGWDAAAAASHPTVGGMTVSGLPRRVPSANLVPGTVTNREVISVRPINRDAAQLAAHTAGYFRGWNRARQDTEEPPYPSSARHR